jgi:hypothetical protein
LDQRRWFEVMKARTLTLIPYPDAPGLQEGFVRWLSQNAQGIGGRASEQVDALWAWVRATGRQLRRGMNGHRVHRERLAWEFQRNGTRRDGGWDARVRRLAAQHPHLARPQPDGSMDLALPCVFDACDVEGFSLRPFFHASELKREGDEMGHCVASLLEEAVAGNRFLHSLRVGEERLTLELLGPAENLTPGQFLGRQNQPPSDEALAALKAWCDDVNIQANRPLEDPPCPAAYG